MMRLGENQVFNKNHPLPHEHGRKEKQSQEEGPQGKQ